jgi:hypothetical protein
MGERLDQCCRDCRARALLGTRYCAAHAKAENAAAKEYDAQRTSRFYYTALWLKTSKNIRIFNPICAKVDENGKQCQRKAMLVHHIKDLRTHPELKLDWHNLVSLCDECHAGGAPGSTASEKYVATLGAFGMVYYHAEHNGGFPQWKKAPENATAMMEASSQPLPCAGRTSAFGDDALDKALAADD